MKKIITLFVFLCAAFIHIEAKDVVLGAEQTKQYLPLLKGKRVALLSNHTGIVIQGKDTIHTLDLLLQHGVEVTAIFTIAGKEKCFRERFSFISEKKKPHCQVQSI